MIRATGFGHNELVFALVKKGANPLHQVRAPPVVLSPTGLMVAVFSLSNVVEQPRRQHDP